MSRNHITPCTPGARCRNWRTCPTCGRIAQSQFADRAETLLAGVPEPALYVLKPRLPGSRALTAAKAYLSALTGPWPAVWTIETAERSQLLHVNCIGHHRNPTTPFDGALYVERIHTNIRAVAAYIRKPQSRPQNHPSVTRTAGTFANWSFHATHDPNYAPLLAGAVLQHQLDPYATPAPAPLHETDAARARRWLATLYDKCPNLRPSSPPHRSK